MDNYALRIAMQQVKDRRILGLELQEKYKERCLDNEEYLDTYKKIKQNILAISRALAEGKNTEKLEKKDKELTAKLQVLEDNLLEEKSFFHCAKCNDTGIVDGKYCDCLIEEYKKVLRKNSGISNLPDFNFEDNNIQNIKCKQSKKLNMLYNSMQKYCDIFPNNNVKNILLCGKVGTGKSCLLSATANRLLDRCVNCLYFTAFNLNSLFLKYHTTDIKTRGAIFASLVNADVLIIDDLGTEPVMKNVTIEYLTTLLNERINKHTIIATNLADKELQDKYGDRIFSRLTNTQNTKILYLDGDDLRHTPQNV